MATSNTKEQSTLSNYQDVVVRHMDIKRLVVDFTSQKLRGVVDYKCRAQKAITEVVLDSNHLEIHSASMNGAGIEFHLSDQVEPFGRAVHLKVGEIGPTTEFSVTVEYSTTADSSALQWLSPEQTAGKVHPYLFTQCQAIHARSMIPCQDSPGVKSTYTAVVHCPAPLTAVMSAIPVGPEQAPTAGESDVAGFRSFAFNQPIPMPSYLVALAVGNLEHRPIGPRSRVYAEPEVVEKAAWEFADTEAFIAAGEGLLGPYVWGRYDLLCLPPSFPYGGMENPCLTFVTPTLLAGDRSLADVVAHEIAHSWTGNLVSPASWNHFWINEGFTMMAQRKIIAKLQGRPSFDFDAFSGEISLRECIDMFMSRHQEEFTKLVPDLSGIDPDDAFSSVPYEKGFYLLYFLQTLVCEHVAHNVTEGESIFDGFLHDYIQTFKFKSITSQDFANYFIAYFKEGRFTLPRVGHSGGIPTHDGSRNPFDMADIPLLEGIYTGAASGTVPPAGVPGPALEQSQSRGVDLSDKVNWDEWFNGVGMPAARNHYDASLRGVVEAHASAWINDTEAAAARHAAVTGSWTTPQWRAFLEKLVTISSELAAQSPEAIINPETLHYLDRVAMLSASRNSEIRSQWCILVIRSGLTEHFAAAIDFLASQGRMKYVRPLFRELLRNKDGRPMALQAFNTFGKSYHPICYKMVSFDITKETEKAPVDPATRRRVGGAAPASTH